MDDLSLLLDLSPFVSSFIFFFVTRRPPSSTLFPYTTLFRSLEPPARFAQAVEGVQRHLVVHERKLPDANRVHDGGRSGRDRKSTRLNSSHVAISYAVFCLKKKKNKNNDEQDNYI